MQAIFKAAAMVSARYRNETFEVFWPNGPERRNFDRFLMGASIKHWGPKFFP